MYARIRKISHLEENCMKHTLERIVLTLFIIWLYGWVWMYLENMIYGAIENRLVDNIMMLLFIPFIFIATDKLIN